MVYKDDVLIVVDAGHGGWDNGASFEGRLEKDDNLALALEVQKQLMAQCVNVLMTRDTDVYVTLQDRALIANNANANLFISLHRNSYIEQTPSTNGVENFIYLTAPPETTGRAAQYVLDSVVEVGVQSNRGVSRGDYYVLRNTIMPAMLLEMGFIINEIDNALFDEHLVEYAAAIAKGAMQYFGLEFREIPGVTPVPPAPVPPGPECPSIPSLCPPCPEPPIFCPPCQICPEVPPACPSCPPCPECPDISYPSMPMLCPPCPVCPPCPPCPAPGGAEVQRLVNMRFGLDMPLTGVFDENTRRNMTKALQIALNSDFNAGLVVDGILGPKTMAAFPNVRIGQRGNVVFMIQALLQMNGYVPGMLDGIFGSLTETAVKLYQRDNCLMPDGVVDNVMISKLLKA